MATDALNESELPSKPMESVALGGAERRAAEDQIPPSSRRGEVSDSTSVDSWSVARPKLPPLPNGTILGTYRITGLLGQGAMGSVYRAEHTLIQRVVALKVVRPEIASRADIVERFLTEVQACVGLAHPNIVTVYDVSIDESTKSPFMTMEYIEGRTLADHVEDSGPMSSLGALDVLRQLAEALVYVSEQPKPIVHRDIKPHNVMLTPNGKAKLLDLGLARFLDEPEKGESSGIGTLNATLSLPGTRLTRVGALLGTVAYMAPEQAKDSRNADTRSDLYSLGCTFYFLISGRHAFYHVELPHLLAQVYAGDFEPLSSVLEARYDTDVDAFVRKLMAKRITDRFQTPREVIAALDLLTEALRRKSPVDMGARLVERAFLSPSEWEAAQTAAGIDADLPTILSRLRRTKSDRWADEFALTKHQATKILEGKYVDLVFDHYRVLRPLGERGLGEVFLAYHADNPQMFVVIKTITGRFLQEAADPQIVDRLKTEVQQIYSTLTHLDPRYFPSVHHIGRKAGLPFLVMGYVRGRTLEQHINLASGTLEIQFLLRVFHAITEALDELHSNGLVHGNIKSSNFMITERRHPVVLDVGLTTAVNAADWSKSKPAADGPIGTPMFTAPEQFFSEAPPRIEADIYSLGVTMFHAVTRRLPFVATNIAELIAKHFAGETPHAVDFRPDVPKRLDAVIARCMATDPNERYRNMTEVADALQNVSSPRPWWRIWS